MDCPLDCLNGTSINLQDVICYCVPDIFDIEEDGITLVLVTKDGKFFEISGKTVGSRFTFSDPPRVVNKIDIFYSYDPKIKYYIVSAVTEVFVLGKKDKKLSLFKKLSNVTDYYITDYRNNGKPQVVFTLKTRKEPLVTDFVDSNFKEPDCSYNVPTHLPRTKLYVKQFERLLEEKKILIAKLTSSFIENVAPLPPMYDNLVTLSKSPIPTHTVQPIINSTYVGQPSVNLLLNKMAICFPITNHHAYPLSNLVAFVAHRDVIVENTILYTLKDHGVFEKQLILGPMKSGYIVSIMDEPCLLKSLELSCVLKYSINSEDKAQQCFLGEVLIDLEKMYSNSKTQDCKPADVLILMSLLEHNELMTLKSNIQIIERALIQIDFNKISQNCYKHSNPNGNEQLVSFQVKRERLIVNFYSISQNQFILLFKNLRKILPDEVEFDVVEADEIDALEAMTKELKFIQSVLLQQMDDGENKPHVGDVLEKMYHLGAKSAKAVSKLL